LNYAPSPGPYTGQKVAIVWSEWMGNIDPAKWVKAYFVKKDALYDTLLAHLMEVWPEVNEARLENVAHELDHEVREVMGWV